MCRNRSETRILVFSWRGSFYKSCPATDSVSFKHDSFYFNYTKAHATYKHILECADVGVCGLAWWRKPQNLGKVTIHIVACQVCKTVQLMFLRFVRIAKSRFLKAYNKFFNKPILQRDEVKLSTFFKIC